MNLIPFHRSILKKGFYLLIDLYRPLYLGKGYLAYLIKILNHLVRVQHSRDVHPAKPGERR